MLNTSNDQRKLLPNFEQLFATTAQAPGGVARLRELILTLAVQGKLVPQDTNDEPASELLKKIRAEKDRLIAEGKIKKDKPLAEITEEEKPFELPVGWEWVRFGKLPFSSSTGLDRGRDQQSESLAYPYFKMNNIANSGGVTYSALIRVNANDEELQKFKLKIGDFLFNTRNSRELVGKTCVIEFLPEENTIFNNNILVSRFHGKIEANFIDAWFRSPLGQIRLDQIKSATTNVCAIYQGNLFHFLCPIPPLAEQSRIVTRVEELMRLCDALEEKGQLEHTQHQQLLQALLDSLTQTQSAQELARNWQRLAQHFDLLIDRPEAVDALEQTILQLAVRGLLVEQDANDEAASELLKKIRLKKDRLIAEGKIKKDKPLPAINDDEKPFDLPARWEWVRMSSLGESFDYGSSQKSVDDSAAVPILRMGNIQGGRVVMSNLKYLKDLQGELPYLFLHKGDLLFNRTNSYELVGKTGLFEGYSRKVTFASYLIRIRLMNGLVNSEYINAYMNTRDCRENEIEPDLTQQTGQANYNGTKLKSIRVPLPPFDEQSRIVARVTELRALCQQLREKLTQARNTQTQLAQAWVEQAAA
ncbi:Type-1 restriction enzyme EcoKI specificity protein [Comamonas sp. PE63]|uniref:Type-1 restriction enzyme EcoKI specificity protein n=1 Tax=Comamonas brasiliensis TaxID=1812482 RepID=A0ABS5LZR9_9BURK|nr:restriction endonuclease subunit S [Comamonas sp. PE63]MBS3021517.1 Type-1 restriction enzyme EcoKI specificity protein [Comamonas sp. PE63]